LVALEILRLALPPQVRWQWNNPPFPRIKIPIERDDSFSTRTNVFHSHPHPLDGRLRAPTHFPAGTNQAFPARVPLIFQEQKLDRAIVRKTARIHHPGVV